MGKKQKIILSVILFLLIFTGCGSKNQKQNIVIKKPVKEKVLKSTEEKKTASNSEEIIIKDTEAKNYVGENVTVTGKIAAVVKRPKVNYLNFGKNYPNQTFTAVIFPDDADEFGDLNEFKGKEVEVSGVISLYNGKPQIILKSKNQIKIID